MADERPTIRICPVCRAQTLWVDEVEVVIQGRTTVQTRGTAIHCRWCDQGEMTTTQYLLWRSLTHNGDRTVHPHDDPSTLTIE